MTILSVNKTRALLGGGCFAPAFFMGANRAHFLFAGDTMNNKARLTVYAALMGAMYAALTHLQNMLLPGSATWAIQLRLSEALCVLSLFTPAAIPGLAVGCFVFNLTFAGALPLDMAVGTLATVLSTAAMWRLRRLPWLAFAMPALFNGLLVGWELTAYIGGGFGLNALYVAIGEAAVLYTLGALLYATLRRQGLSRRIFPE